MIIPNRRLYVISRAIRVDGPLALLCLLIGGLVGEVYTWGFMSFVTGGLIVMLLIVAAYYEYINGWLLKKLIK